MGPHIYCLIVLSLVRAVNSQSYINYTNLVDDVLQGYNVDIIPLDDHSQTLNISVRATFYSLLDVDVVKGRISVLLTLTCNWLDSQITWTPSLYGNITSLSFPRKKVWSPTLVLGSAVDFTVIGDTWMPVFFDFDGSTSMTLGDVINSGCSFNMKFWPFDRQTCDIRIAAFGYTMSQLQLQTTEKSLILYLLNENVEWDLIDVDFFVKEGTGVSEVNLRVVIERRSSIFVILIIFPLYGLACLNSMVFLLPSESGERIGFCATIMLSFTVFLEVISDYIPNTSKPIPLLCIMVTMGISMSILCIFTNIVSLHFFHKDDEIPVNGCLQNMVKLFNKDFRRTKVKATTKPETKDDCVHRFNEELKLQEFDKADTNGVKSEAGEMKIPRWTDVSYTIDRVCFIGATLAHGLWMIGFTLYLTIDSD